MVPTKHCRKSIGLWIRRVAASAFAGVRHAERLFKRDDGFLSLCGDPSSPAASVHHDVRKAGVSACAPIAGTEITRIPVPAENLIRVKDLLAHDIEALGRRETQHDRLKDFYAALEFAR